MRVKFINYSVVISLLFACGFIWGENSSSLEETGLEKKEEQENKILDISSVQAPDISKESIYLYDYADNINSSRKIPDSLIINDYDYISDSNATDSKGKSKLMLASETGDEKLIKNLLQSGANINATDCDGWTALMYACRYQKNPLIVKLLIDSGAYCSVKNKYGFTALIIAASFNDNTEILSLILKKYENSPEEIKKAFVYAIHKQNDPKILQIFTDNGCSINSLYKGKSLLMIACESGKDMNTIEWLLNNGASKNIVEYTTGMTAFDYALKNKLLPHNEVFWSLKAN